MLLKIRGKKFAALDVIRSLSEKITCLNKQADMIRIENNIPDRRSIPEDFKDMAYKAQELLVLLKASGISESENHIKTIEDLLRSFGVKNGK